MGGRPSLGHVEALTFRRIIFPQAFRIALGPMTNDFVALFKDTSLVSVIAVRELTKEYLILSRSSREVRGAGAADGGAVPGDVGAAGLFVAVSGETLGARKH